MHSLLLLMMGVCDFRRYRTRPCATIVPKPVLLESREGRFDLGACSKNHRDAGFG